jgi:fructose-1,6-bisphosphatase/inositol monophosphatase family enzyme
MEPHDPHAFVRLLAPAMEQAAAIATALEGRVPNVPKPGARTAVKAALTIADTAAQETLLVPLAPAFLGARLEAEEDTRSVARFTGAAADVRIVIDPIDGTLHYYLGEAGPYAVMAGLALRDRYEAALVALPREGWLLSAVRGEGALRSRLGGEPEAAALAREGRGVYVSDRVPEPVVERIAAAGFAVQRACGGAVAVAPLVPGVRGGIRVRPGSISTRGRIGLLVAAEAGARVETGDGRPFPDDLDTPSEELVVAADADVAAVLRRALRG